MEKRVFFGRGSISEADFLWLMDEAKRIRVENPKLNLHRAVDKAIGRLGQIHEDVRTDPYCRGFLRFEVSRAMAPEVKK